MEMNKSNNDPDIGIIGIQQSHGQRTSFAPLERGRQ